jgi:hypothetical protein
LAGGVNSLPQHLMAEFVAKSNKFARNHYV